ncbi:hypothetical protein [Streptomyces violascens]|uniref:hypothetical protein n=1 Tax=Streptomyces violascens TaxID=67381 RepID=UPI001678F536|nr:hypothetical protein [Streptomyces violascens]GGU50930.1 hypothetical protein GCM10010289_84210 [Streptomyces violascens]
MDTPDNSVLASARAVIEQAAARRRRTDRLVTAGAAASALIFWAGCFTGWWWSGGRAGTPVFGLFFRTALADPGPHENALAVVLRLSLGWLVAAMLLAASGWLLLAAWWLVTDLIRRDDPAQRYTRQHRTTDHHPKD